MTDGKETQQQPVEKKIVRHKTAKRILRAVAAVAVVLFVLPSLLYIPGVQRAVKNFVVEKVAESTGYTVEIGELSLKFPLRLSIDNLLVLDEHRDTMIQSRHVATNVRLLSLQSLSRRTHRRKFLCSSPWTNWASEICTTAWR